MGRRRPRPRRGAAANNAAAKAPGNVAALKKEADEAVGRRLYQHAIALYSDAITSATNEACEDVDTAAALYANRSHANLCANKPEDALDDADAAVRVRPDWAKGYFRRGKALACLLRHQDAEEAFRDAVRRDPGNASFTSALRDLPYEELVYWLKAGSATFPKLSLQVLDRDQHRGVYSTGVISPDEAILRVPLRFIITTELAKQSRLGQALLQSKVSLRSQHTFLAVFLLNEREKPYEESRWAPYLKTLPQSYANMPIHFSDEDMAFLEGSFAVAKIASRIESLSLEYDAIVEAVPELARWSVQDFIWARHVVITRIFGMTIDNVKTNGLVPMADMLNHRRPRETKWTYDQATACFTISSVATIESNMEVFDSYGRKCNSRFFVNYGFALADNEDNETLLTFMLSPDDPLALPKRRLFGADFREYQIPADMSAGKTRECLAFVRLLLSDVAEWTLLRSRDPMDLQEIAFVSRRNELAVLQAVKAAAEEVLQRFSCSIEEDTELVQSGELSDNQRNAVYMRRGEKVVARFFVGLSDAVSPLLQSSSPHSYLAKHMDALRPYSPYFEAVLDAVSPPVGDGAEKDSKAQLHRLMFGDSSASH